MFLEILGNMCIVIICFLAYDVTIFEIMFKFLIKAFFYITKKSGQNLNILRTKRAFEVS